MFLCVFSSLLWISRGWRVLDSQKFHEESTRKSYDRYNTSGNFIVTPSSIRQIFRSLYVWLMLWSSLVVFLKWARLCYTIWKYFFIESSIKWEFSTELKQKKNLMVPYVNFYRFQLFYAPLIYFREINFIV